MHGAPESFRFYYRDYVTAAAVMQMSLAEQGAYIRLLCQQFEYGEVRVHLLPAILQLADDEITALLAGPVGQCFEEVQPGVLQNAKLADIRERAMATSEKARRSAQRRWSGAANTNGKADTPKKKRTRSRVNGKAELAEAISLHSLRGEFPPSLAYALEGYRALRASKGWAVWRRDKWLKNLSEDYTMQEWEDAYRKATDCEWQSIHPKKRGSAPGNKAPGNPFAGLNSTEHDLPNFEDPNKLL